MNDIELIHVFSTKENYDRFIKFIKDHTISPYTKQILRDFDEYYKTVGVAEIDPASFATWFKHTKHLSMKPDKVTVYDGIFAKWVELASAPELPVVDKLIESYVRLDYLTQITDLSLKGMENAAISITDIGAIVEEFYKEASLNIADADSLDVDEVSSALSVIAASLSHGAGLEWRLEELNVSCGPLRKGDFVEVAAYVDSGKTTFLASEVTHMATQLLPGDYVAWINNEEQGGKVRLRLYSATLGLTRESLLRDIAKYEGEYALAMGGDLNRIRIKDDASLSTKELDLFFERVKPKLIVFDMLDKIKGFEDSPRDDIRLQKLYQWARECAKRYGPVIASTQVDGSGANSKWINMNQLAGSKVAKQGEADAIITIGRIVDEDSSTHDPDTRYIHIPKNKLPGGDRTQESERNGYWEVKIVPPIARYKGNIKP